MSVERIPTCCALCISRCGCIAVVEDGRLARIEPDPAPTAGRPRARVPTPRRRTG